MVISLERDAELHMAQLMPLPLTVSCFSKILIGFTFLVPADPGSPGQRAVKRVYVCSPIILKIITMSEFQLQISHVAMLLSAEDSRCRRRFLTLLFIGAASDCCV